MASLGIYLLLSMSLSCNS
ncbi:unnamed protein product [Linum tenue]|uniref:Uncharacterized protein n=1 Tax=Linum tenue TaxID=586396 RepID=A0AAV0KN28_9ROSI|nr:unnamed protein product [Linum tenue]